MLDQISFLLSISIVQGLRLLLVPLLPLGGGSLLLIARLLHANHLRSKVEVIKKDHLSMYYLKNIYWARIFFSC